jgi:transposase InsO family protein
MDQRNEEQEMVAVVWQSGAKPIMLPASTPNLNAFGERWVRSVHQECLSKLILM